METITLSKELHEKIVKFIEEHPVEADWDYRDSLDDTQIVKILEDGLNNYENVKDNDR
jgi:hypothetical protein